MVVTEQPAGDAPGEGIRFTLHERTLRGPVVGRFAFDRNAPELSELRVGAVIDVRGQRWKIVDCLVGGASGFLVVERAQ